jgi:hypothetical protein
MTDTTIIAIIVGAAGLPASIGAAISLFNRFVLSAVQTQVGEVKVNINGNLIELKNQLTIMTMHYQRLIEVSSLAQGISEEKERGRLAGDAKYAEGVQSERERNRLRAEVPK